MKMTLAFSDAIIHILQISTISNKIINFYWIYITVIAKLLILLAL